MTQLGKSAQLPGAKPSGRPKGSSGGQSASRSRPSNQHGTRIAPKTSKDISDERLNEWLALVDNRYQELASWGVSYDTVAVSLLYRLEEE